MQRFLFSVAVVAIATGASSAALAGNASDQAKAQQIAAVLRDSGKLQNYSVGVKYKGGTAWLSGRVASEGQMDAALGVVSEMPGIEKIVNRLSVAPAPAGGRAEYAGSSAAAQRYARRASASSPVKQAEIVEEPYVPRRHPSASGDVPLAYHRDSGVTPAGYHRLAARKAARHACPPTMYRPIGGGANPPAYDQPHLPNYAWPSYAAYPNYAALTYPRQYSPTAWPYIGPFYPYPQVPLGWRKVALEWDDGWWFLDFYDRSHH